MYLDHWGLDHSPFRVGLDVERFYRSPTHDEALARVEFLVDTRRRMGALLGPRGVGKSFVLEMAARHFQRQGAAVAQVDALGLGTREFLFKLAADLATRPNVTDEPVRLWQRIANRIPENRLQGLATVLLVDDAGQAGPDVMTQLVRLARIDPQPDARWTIVLAAHPQQTARWNSSLVDLIDLRIDLVPWERNDTIGFVQSALVGAGRLDPIFEEAALSTLHELAGGVPRQVARIADFALLAGAGAELSSIDAPTVRAAFEELSWRATPAGN